MPLSFIVSANSLPITFTPTNEPTTIDPTYSVPNYLLLKEKEKDEDDTMDLDDDTTKNIYETIVIIRKKALDIYSKVTTLFDYYNTNVINLIQL